MTRSRIAGSKVRVGVRKHMPVRKRGWRGEREGKGREREREDGREPTRGKTSFRFAEDLLQRSERGKVKRRERRAAGKKRERYTGRQEGKSVTATATAASRSTPDPL